MSKIYGCIGVSSRNQNEDRQPIALTDRGVSQKNLFTDKLSGKNFDRPAYQRMISKLKPGDLIAIKGIDWFCRNYSDSVSIAYSTARSLQQR